MNLTHKNIVLTGASSGIGLSLLQKLIDYQGVKIVAVARHTEAIPVAEGVVFPFSADLSKSEGVDRVFGYAQSVLGTIDLFIANAGYAYRERLSDPDWTHIESIFSLNTFSPIYALQQFVKQDTITPLCFVTTLSAVVQVPLPYYSLYCSSKAALHQFIEAYRYEAPSHVQLLSVYPVATQTAFFEKAASEKNASLPFLSQTPEAVASAIVKGIERDKKHIYPFCLFRIFNWLGQNFPILFTWYSVSEKRKVEKKLRT